MDATGGVEAGLELAVALGRCTNTAACFFINKCDKENADPTAALDALRATFGNKIAPLQLAIGAAHDFRATSTSSTARPTSARAARRSRPTIPDDMADEVARRRDQLLEAAAEADDDVLVKYLEGEEVSDPELEACLRKGVKESILAPVLVGSLGQRDRAAGAARRDRPLPPLPRRRRPGHRDRQGRAPTSRSRRTRTARSSPASSRPPRTRSSGG